MSGLAYTTEDNYRTTEELNEDKVITLKSDAAQETTNAERTTIFRFGDNIISDKRLTYKRADDSKMLVLGKSKQGNGKLLKAQAGDTGGDVTTINYPNLSQTELEDFVQNRLARSKYEGFVGSFEAFLKPKVQHGETVQMINSDIPEKDGLYLIKKVVTKFGIRGGRQTITLDRKIDS